MKTPIFFTGSPTSNVSNAAVRYAPFTGVGPGITSFGTPSATAITQAVQSPIAGTVSSMRVRFPTPLTQGSYQVTLMKGTSQTTMVATALSVTIGTAAIDASELTATVTVAAGEYLAWRITPTDTPTAQAASIQIACLFEATTAGRSALYSFIALGSAACAVAPGAGAPNNLTESAAMMAMPIAGSFTKLYASLNANAGAPGTGNSRTFTLRKNGSDTGLTVTFGATDAEKMIDLSGSPVAVAVGDLLSLVQTITGTPTASVTKLSLEFVPATAGQSVRVGTASGAFSATATRYAASSGYSTPAETTEANVAQLVPADMTVKSLRFDTTSAPGSGKSRALMLRKNLADTALSTTLADLATVSSAAADVAFLGGDTIDLAHIPANTPASGAWSSYTSVMTVTGGGPPPATLGITMRPDGHVYEGILAKAAVPHAGTRPSGQDIEIQIETAAGAVVLAYGSADIAISYPSATTWKSVSALNPNKSDLRIRARLKATPATVVAPAATFGVGHVWLMNGQSWLQRGSTTGKAPNNGAPTSVTANNVRIAQTINRDDGPNATYRVDRLDAVNRTGSGYTTLADQIGLMMGTDTFPIMIHDCTYSGQALDDWMNDVSPNGWPLLTGFLPWSLAQCDGRITAVIREVMFGTVKYASRSAGIDALVSVIDGLLTNQPAGKPAEIWLLPGWRSPSSSVPAFIQAREDLTAKAAASPARFKALAQSPDIQTDVNGGNHGACGAGAGETPAKDDSAAAHQAGQIRFFRRIGFSLGAQYQRIHGLTIADVYGARVVAAKFTDATKSAFDVTWDRDIKAAGGATTGLPQHWVSTGTFAVAGTNTECTAVQTGPRTLRVAHPTGGNWQGVALRYGYLRGDMPWGTVAGANGGETAIRSKLDTLIYDTSTYEGGRGLAAEPMLGQGLAVQDASAASYTAVPKMATGTTLTLTKAQAATLRVRDTGVARAAGVSAEPISLRWERKAGDTTGKPFDGINVPLTVA